MSSFQALTGTLLLMIFVKSLSSGSLTSIKDAYCKYHQTWTLALNQNNYWSSLPFELCSLLMMATFKILHLSEVLPLWP